MKIAERELRRIGIITGSLKRSGAERVACDLALGMKSKGIDVTFFSLYGGDLEKELEDAGIYVRTLVKDAERYSPNLIRSLFFSLKLAYMFRFRRIQAVNIHGLGPERIAILAARLACVQVKSFVFHSNYPELDVVKGDQSKIARLKKNINQIDHCIAITDSIMKMVVKSQITKSNKICVISNGIDEMNFQSDLTKKESKRILGFSNQEVLLIQVGRFSAMKNQDITISALNNLKTRYPNIHILLVGTGPLMDKAVQRVKELGLENRVHFLGVRSDVKDLLAASDIFLIPSDWEGLPISMLEAFACSVPVIGTNIPGIKEIVEIDRACAKLVEPKNTHELTNAIKDAVDDKEWLEKSKHAGYGIVKSYFRADHMIDQYISLHNRLFLNNLKNH